MRRLSALVAFVCVVSGCTARQARAPGPSGAPAVDQHQTLLLISIDGFRWDYINRPGAAHLRALAARGVRAERMVPSFPSLTFPNHYTIVTGLYPEHHGIVANAMIDPVLGRFGIGDNPAVRDARWWGGEPIWLTAEKQHVRAAPVSWPGAEAPIGGIRPTWWEKFDGTLSAADRARRVLSLLAMPADSGPRLITQYFPQVDHEGHFFGPDGAETNAAIMQVDSAVGAIIDGISRLGLTNRVNVIVLADHGMAALNIQRTVYVDDYVSSDSMDVIEWGALTSIAPKPNHERYVYDRLKGANPHLAIYHPAEVPARLHYSSNPRIAPVLAIAEEGWNVTTHARAKAVTAPYKGTHGFDNQLVSMGALFVASGPAFKSGVVVPPFQNVHVYDLMAHLLGLRPAPNDGSLDSTRVMLR